MSAAMRKTKVLTKKVPNQERAFVLQKYVGEANKLATQNEIFAAMRNLSKDYIGGLWEFYELSNGGILMMPRAAGVYRITGIKGCFEMLSAECSGILACLLSFNFMSIKTRNVKFFDLYYKLMEFAEQHPEYEVLEKVILKSELIKWR